MINYKEIWRSINDESRSSIFRSQIARRIPSKGIVPTFLASDVSNSSRALYFQIQLVDSNLVKRLPVFRGLEILYLQTSVGEYESKYFIELKQSIPNTDNIFELVISDICDRILKLNELNDFVCALSRVLSEWKLFFDKLENGVFSLSFQKGLYGELVFLRDFLFNKHKIYDAINCWTGSERSNHDFQIGNNAVEIKTTAGKRHRKFYVSSEKQLDSTGLDNLFLLITEINTHLNMYGNRLPDIVESIFEIIDQDPVAKMMFEVKLCKYGYNHLFSDSYKYGFSVSNTQVFEVKEGFPRLLSVDVSNGVGDLKYSVMIDACEPFKLNGEILDII